ncbi:MAG: hypothetical protein ACREDR_17085 [Blastocatellia bacterium]
MRSRRVARSALARGVFALFAIALLFAGAVHNAQSAPKPEQAPALSGNWIVEFTLAGQAIKVQFEAQALMRVTATDINGAAADAVSSQTFRIK